MQSVQNNMLLDTGHSAYQLSQAKRWSNFTVPDPIQLCKIEHNTFLLTSHDSENSCAVMKIEPSTGFGERKKIETENHKVFSACLLNSGVQGVSMTLESGAE